MIGSMKTATPIELGPEGEFERKRLKRLIRLQSSDNGFFLLACHSYIESSLRQKFHLWEEENSFADLIFRFKISLIEKANGFPSELSVLQTLRLKEKAAEAVKHGFVEISAEEAVAAAYRLIQFCKLAGIENQEQLDTIRTRLETWKERSLITEDELTSLKSQLLLVRNRNSEILAEVEQLRTLREENKNLRLRIESLETSPNNDAALSDKPEIERLNRKREHVIGKIAALKPADRYLDDLARLTGYTRTRFEFERDITRLTAEQQAVLDSINLTDDFLIKGGAGTGKTLVLIKALEKALTLLDSELQFSAEKTSVRMLTYNRTLARYDRYIAELLKQDDDKAEISTIDKFLYDKFKTINADYRIIFDDGFCEQIIDETAETAKADFMNSRELAAEIDGYIFGSMINREEYIGSGRGLKRNQRELIWTIAEKLAAKMTDTLTFSKNYSRTVILDYISQNRNGVELVDTDFAFIDEVQDLTAADIKTVKACVRRAVILAGDSDQSIYQDGFTFGRAGIDIRGTTRILRKNFRNSCEIQETAEKYRLMHSSADTDTSTEAFRTGPPPELYTAKDTDALLGMLIMRVKIFTEELHYDPENICILVPSSRDIAPLQNKLRSEGLESCDLRDDEFSFSTRGIIRISTMHSSKGLDFPVVLLYLHKLPQTATGDNAAQKKMRRNLIYVSMTRAMDHLNIFVPEDEKSPEICDLTGLFN